jgi:hypothetical protein
MRKKRPTPEKNQPKPTAISLSSDPVHKYLARAFKNGKGLTPGHKKRNANMDCESPRPNRTSRIPIAFKASKSPEIMRSIRGQGCGWKQLHTINALPPKRQAAPTGFIRHLPRVKMAQGANIVHVPKRSRWGGRGSFDHGSLGDAPTWAIQTQPEPGPYAIRFHSDAPGVR